MPALETTRPSDHHISGLVCLTHANFDPFDQATRDFLPFAGPRFRRVPKRGYRGSTPRMSGVPRRSARSASRAKPVIGVLCRCCCRRSLPAFFQGPGDQPILWLDCVVMALGRAGFIRGTFQVLTELCFLLPPLLARVFDGAQTVRCCRRKCLKNCRADELVKVSSG